MMRRNPDLHFRSFAKSLELVIAGYVDPDMPKDRQERQRLQIKQLLDREKQFRLALIRTQYGTETYEAFIKHIRDELRNTLAARPFFRERQSIFSSEISPALHSRKAKALMRFHFNYQFIAWCMSQRKWNRNTSLPRLFREIQIARAELIDTNTPLAISRARIFFKFNPAAHLEFMDVVQTAVEGLIAAVDKFVPAENAALAGVACQRMTGNFIEAATEPLIHFYPREKKKAYRAHKARKIFGDDVERITKFVNTDPKTGKQLPAEERSTADEVVDLMAAASTVSADTAVPHVFHDGDAESMISSYAADESCQPDIQVEARETYMEIQSNFQHLSVLERKVLRMRGVEL